MAYDVTAHPLLSADAAALATGSPTAFAAWVGGIARMFGIAEITFTGEKLDDAETAIVLTLNATLAANASGPSLQAVKREKAGDEETEYFGDPKKTVVVPDLAWLIIRKLVGKVYPRSTTLEFSY